MIRLNLNPQPEWIELLTGVRVKVAPLTTAVVLSVRAHLPAEADREMVGFEFTTMVAERVIVEWQGVTDEAGADIPVTAEAVRQLMSLYQVYVAFERAFIAKWALLTDEKKGFAPLPSGTSAGAPTTAAPATASAPTAQAR